MKSIGVFGFLPASLLLVLMFAPAPPQPSRILSVGTVVLADDGEPLRVFLNDAEQLVMPWPDSGGVPEKLEAALLLSEDRHFHRHAGVNPGAVVRAALQNIDSGRVVSGASTITMQLARLLDPKPRTIWSKMREAIQATRIELRSTKSRILIDYLRSAPYGGNVIGAPAAAMRYFGKSIHALTWAEIATLTVLPRAPGIIYPDSGSTTPRSAALAIARDRLLKDLFENGLLEEDAFRRALAEPVPSGPRPLPFEAPHLSERLNSSQIGGAVMRSHIDRRLQREIERVASIHADYLHTLGIDNLAIVVAETESGHVVSYLGSHDFFDAPRNGFVDGVFASRSSGSILKPFLYALAIDSGLIGPDSMIIDIPTHFGAFSPQNVGFAHFGMLTASEALARSLNIPAVRLLDSYGVADFYYFLERAGISTLFRAPSDYGLTLILGGAEVNLFELVGLYRSLGNGGAYEPLKLVDGGARMAETGAIPVVSGGAAYLTLQMLEGLSRPGEESWWERQTGSAPLAWKTGTSYANRDAWAVGVSPEWTIGVWIGNFEGGSNVNLVSTRTSAPLLFDVFNLLPKESRSFPEPKSAFRDATICLDTGYLAGPACERHASARFPINADYLPVCPYHRHVHLNESGTHRLSSLCWEGRDVHVESRLFYPTEAVQYLTERGAVFERIPPLDPDCATSRASTSDGLNLEIVYPQEQSRLFIPRGLDGRLQSINLKAAHRLPESRIFWYLDGAYVGETSGQHAVAMAVRPGDHQLRIVDERGDQKMVEFSVWAAGS